MNWEMYGALVASLGFLYQLHRSAKKDLQKKFDSIDERFESLRSGMENGFEKVREDISEVKERMAFLEAAHIYTMPIEPAQTNPRSEAAKNMWKRRKQMKIEKKGS